MLNGRASQKRTLDGETYMVSPVVALRETVLPDSPVPGEDQKVPALITKESIKNSLPLWEGEKITLGHPSQKGIVGPAGQKSTKEKLQVGYFFNVGMKSDKLKGEAWINRNKASGKPEGRELLDAQRNNKNVEVSTGYFADLVMLVGDEPTVKTLNGPDRPLANNLSRNIEGLYKGEQYEGIQMNIRPDHLAILTRGTGKCSVDEGCGINNQMIVENVLSLGREPNYSDLASKDDRQWPSGGPTLADFVDGFLENADTDLTEDELSRRDWKANPIEFREWASMRSLLGEADEDTFDRGVLLPAVFPDTDELSEDGLESINQTALQGEGVSEKAQNSAKGIARNLLKNQFDQNLSLGAKNMDECDSFFTVMKAMFSNEISLQEAVDRLKSQENELPEGETTEEQENTSEQEIEDKNKESETEGGDLDLAELNDEQKEALSECSAETILALSSLNPDDLDDLVELAQSEQEKKEGMIYALAVNDDVPFGEDELRDKSLQELSMIADMVASGNDDDSEQSDNDSSENVNYSGQAGMPNGVPVNGDADEEELERFTTNNLAQKDGE